MVGVFAIFATLPIIDMKEMGIGLAAAVLIDATIVRAVLLPATMKLLGDWNWYLPTLARVAARGSSSTASRSGAGAGSAGRLRRPGLTHRRAPRRHEDPGRSRRPGSSCVRSAHARLAGLPHWASVGDHDRSRRPGDAQDAGDPPARRRTACATKVDGSWRTPDVAFGSPRTAPRLVAVARRLGERWYARLARG